MVQSRSNKCAALKLMRKLLKKYGFVPGKLVTGDLQTLPQLDPPKDFCQCSSCLQHPQRPTPSHPPSLSRVGDERVVVTVA